MLDATVSETARKGKIFMRGNGENIRVASSKEVMIMLTALLIFSTLICLGEQTGGLLQKKLAGPTKDVACEIINIRTEYHVKFQEQYSVFRDEQGNTYELKTTFSDSIGRKTDLSVAGSRGFRKSYEIVKPQTVGWAVYLMPIVCIVSLIYYPIKAKEMGLWEWEKQ